MPRRARPGDRTAIEAALTPTLRAALAEFCDLFGIRPDGWQRTGLDASFTAAAVVLLAAGIRLERGCHAQRAHEAACRQLGVSPRTIENRINRWVHASVVETDTHYRGFAPADLGVPSTHDSND